MLPSILSIESIVNIVFIVSRKSTEKGILPIGSKLNVFGVRRILFSKTWTWLLPRVTQYAQETVAYGTNYFLKVSIDDGLFIHIRIHRHKNQERYDFYALHEVIRHNVASFVFTKGSNFDHSSFDSRNASSSRFRRTVDLLQLLNCDAIERTGRDFLCFFTLNTHTNWTNYWDDYNDMTR